MILVSLFLILWYRLPGIVAVLALGLYTIIILALFKLIPVTLTAAGIAGFILSVGMAVDAAFYLIFERIRRIEEREKFAVSISKDSADVAFHQGLQYFQLDYGRYSFLDGREYD